MSKFMLNGEEPVGLLIDNKPAKKPDKVEPTLDEALAKVTIEWME